MVKEDILYSIRKIFKVYFTVYIMFGWLFSNKKEFEKIESETKQGFERVKDDISNVSKWIKHLDQQDEDQGRDIKELKEILSSMEIEIEGIKNMLSLIGSGGNKQMFKTAQQVFDKHTPVYPVQTDVQTDVQTPNLSDFSVSEKAIIWLLLNSDLRLSYEDLAAMTGKQKATIRGQVNNIKQKSEDLIKESIERNGKKRLYIPLEMKENMLKRRKVRVKKRGKWEEK